MVIPQYSLGLACRAFRYLDSPSFCLNILSAETTSVHHHHTQYLRYFKPPLGRAACQVLGRCYGIVVTLCCLGNNDVERPYVKSKPGADVATQAHTLKASTIKEPGVPG